MPPAPLLAILVACAELFHVYATRLNYTDRSIRAIDPLDPGGCAHEGHWYSEGALVRTREACLRCTCVRGVLACARRACAPLPDPPPRRCHVLHRKGACCPELHCPDGVKLMELGASARFEDEDYSDAGSTSIGHACVEGGTVFGAGSALASGVACEQCFCLGGARRCVRPRCLPPPPGCAPRPAPGACCPQRYYCTHPAPPPHGTHDCKVEDTWYVEGERVATAEHPAACTHCFCLRGAVRCQPLACAPPLLGCTPRLRPGECCPHQYHCEHTDKSHHPLSHNSLMSVRNDDRSLHTSKSSKVETSTKSVTTSIPSTKTNTPVTITTKKVPVTMTKVKRKTDELPLSISQKSPSNVTSTTTTELPTSTALPSTTEKLVRSNFETPTADDFSGSEELSDQENVQEVTTTEQPDNSVRIVINGTINCTAELSSTSLPLNLTTNDTDRIKMEVQPRVPIMSTGDIESQTFNPNDIITDRSVNGEFDDNEMFTINVTSSLSANSSRAPGQSISTISKITVPADQPSVLNISKKTNEFDFDYAEPTLPPSLPNLKIIPFVAADAVVDDDEPPKEVLTYPILEREDKYPVYYPTLEAKDTSFASRREDIYHPTQYPIFTSDKVDTSQYPMLSHEVDISSSDYPTANNNMLHEQTVSTSLGTHVLEIDKAVTKTPTTSTTFRLETPSVNLFSPPVETEGGFIPKGPGIIDEYYAVYPSTPSAPSVPHLTTSMQLDTAKDCITTDGHRISEGTTVDLVCSVCTCTLEKLHCTPRNCLAPDGCYYSPAPPDPNGDICCGELICVEVTEKETTSTSTTTTTEKVFVTINESISQSTNETEKESILSQNETKKVESATQHDNNNNGSAKVTTTTTVANNVDKGGQKDIVSTSTSTATSTETTSTSPSATITTTTIKDKEFNQTHFPLADYEEEEDDEGFSFGSVLKLLLSDSYDATTASPYKKKPVTTTAAPAKIAPTRITMTPLPSTTKRPAPKPTIAPFLPMPHYPYVPPKKTFHQNTVNRIDHLVLGEATAIKKPTPRPTLNPFKPVMTKPTTQRPFFTTRTTTRKEVSTVQTTVSPEGPRPPANVLPGVGGLKLAGCNIYGRMYRVGRIIAELSTPCQECRCTELGVQCRPLAC